MLIPGNGKQIRKRDRNAVVIVNKHNTIATRGSKWIQIRDEDRNRDRDRTMSPFKPGIMHPRDGRANRERQRAGFGGFITIGPVVQSRGGE